jgi:hypothetical protein
VTVSSDVRDKINSIETDVGSALDRLNKLLEKANSDIKGVNERLGTKFDEKGFSKIEKTKKTSGSTGSGVSTGKGTSVETTEGP